MKNVIENKINEIAKCIIEYISQNNINRLRGVYDGEFGILLFLVYYSNYIDNEEIYTITNDYANSLLDIMDRNYSHTFCGGLSGILYFFELLRLKKIMRIDIRDAEKSLDTFLIKKMKRDIQTKNFDFMHGALGVGLYFVKKKSNIEYVNELVDSLYETAEVDINSGGIKWKSIIDFENNKTGYNIALSHGMSSIVIFLCRALKTKVDKTKVLELISRSVKYIFSQKGHCNEASSFFPNYSLESESDQLLGFGSRLAWCYGDLGISYALWYAGRTLKNKEWENEGLYILIESTKRQTKKKSRIVEAGICHGSSGVMMIFRRLYIETKNELFLEAVHFWAQETLNLAQFKNGLAGYKSLETNKWYLDYSLLGGIAGIGLSLISYLKDDSQDWDEVFLL